MDEILFNEQNVFDTVRNTIKWLCLQMASKVGFDFDENVPLDAFLNQILFWCLKDRITDKLLRKSICSYGERDTYEEKNYLTSENEKVQRIRKQILERKKLDYARLGIQNNLYIEPLENLPPPQKGQFPGYRYNDLDYRALHNLTFGSRLNIITYLNDRRITVAKKVSGEDIKNAYIEYMNYLHRKSEVDDPVQWVYNLFDIASMEGSLCISLIYYMACYMEKNNLKTIPDQITYLCGVYTYPDGQGSIQSRLLVLRNSMIPFVCETPRDDVIEYFEKRLFPLHMCTLRAIKENELLCTAIDKIPMERLATYFRESYNLFDFSCDSKDFSPQFVKKLRKAAEAVIDPVVYPPKKEKTVPCSE